jgi:formate--tetrahydrofolate ligase
MRPISELAAALDLHPDDVVPWGRHVAKVELAALDRPGPRAGRLILVTAITPTPAGEGKTTTAVGLAQGLARRGHRAVAALREPSLGPVFGRKGGGTGGGRSTLEPSSTINLHLTGDLHAVSAAHNLLAALVDHHLHFRGQPALDAQRVTWRRVLDVNDRALREIVTGLSDGDGPTRKTGFDITAASELLAIHGLAADPADLAARLGRLVVGRTADDRPVTAADLGAVGALQALLLDALLPNLVQTAEGDPALVHGGPFANIAHGTSSLIATRLALRQADWVVTEAGFAADLGAVKFAHIVAPLADLRPAAAVVVATARALRHHGGAADAANPDLAALTAGLANLDHHVGVIQAMGLVPVVALNRFPNDSAEEIAHLADHCRAAGVAFAVADPFGAGGPGCIALADLVTSIADPRAPQRLDKPGAPPAERLDALVRASTGADGVDLSPRAIRDLARATRDGHGDLPICLSKTPLSLSADPTLRNRPTGFRVPVIGVDVSAGAGFLVVHTTEPTRMPGLPKDPQARRVGVVDGRIVGAG